MLRKLSFLANKPANSYLYIPFTREEVSESFFQLIEKFQIVGIFKNKKFVILWHGEGENLANLSSFSQVYVLGHGLPLPENLDWNRAIQNPNLPFHLLKDIPFEDWLSTIHAEHKAISIHTVAQRMIEDGLLHSNDINIKLWICDSNLNMSVMAQKFSSHFVDFNNTFKIDYYPGYSLTRLVGYSNFGIHKWATINHKPEARASEIRRSIFLFHRPEQTYASDVILLLDKKRRHSV